MRFTLAGMILGILLLTSTGVSVNCMWDQSCEEEKYNIDFCGNGVCDPFETVDTCADDCGTIYNTVKRKFISFFGFDKEDSGGVFGSIGNSSMRLMVRFFFGIIVAVVLSVILIALYNRIVETIERED